MISRSDGRYPSGLPAASEPRRSGTAGRLSNSAPVPANHREVQLNNVLYHRHTVVLGEAGSGKSVVARKAIELAAQQGLIPDIPSSCRIFWGPFDADPPALV